MSTTRVLVILSLTTTPSRVFLSGIGLSLYAVRRILSSRSRSTVFTLARSRFAWPTLAGFFATPTASWSLKLKSSSVNSFAFCSSSSLCISRHLVASIVPASEGPRPAHELGLDADFLSRQPEPITRARLVHAFHLVENASGLDHGHPELGIALSFAHPGLGGLLRHRLVGKDPDEDLAASLHTAGEGHAGRLDLAIGDPTRLERLQAVVAEREGRAPLGEALHPASLSLAILDTLGHQHGLCL